MNYGEFRLSEFVLREGVVSHPHCPEWLVPRILARFGQDPDRVVRAVFNEEGKWWYEVE